MLGLAGQFCDESGCYDTGTSLAVDPSTYPTLNTYPPGANPNVTTLNYPNMPTYTPPSSYPSSSPSQTSSGATGSWWNTLAVVLGGAGKVLGTRYSVPQLNPGQYISTNAQGTTMYQLAPGQTSMPSGMNFGNVSGYLPLLLIGGVVILAISAMGHK